MLEHDPEKWVPAFPRDKREAFARRSCSNKRIERDDDSKRSHPALARVLGWTPAKSLEKPRGANTGNFATRQWRAGGRQARVHQIPYVALVIEPEQVPEFMGKCCVGRAVSDRADAKFLIGGAPPLSLQTCEPAAD